MIRGNPNGRQRTRRHGPRTPDGGTLKGRLMRGLDMGCIPSEMDADLGLTPGTACRVIVEMWELNKLDGRAFDLG